MARNDDVTARLDALEKTVASLVAALRTVGEAMRREGSMDAKDRGDKIVGRLEALPYCRRLSMSSLTPAR
jgi:hypothetical protein